MLRVTHLSSSGEAVAAYLSAGLRIEDGSEAAQVAAYYGDEASYWLGALADSEGLLGQPVDGEILSGMLEGTLPSGEKPGQLHEKNRRLGEDFTFSAPKSVSILSLALGDNEVISAHDEAVKIALNFVQKQIVYARRGKGSTIREDAPDVAIAVHRHIDARPADGVVAPDLHSHCVVPNLGRRKDGTLGGIKIDMGENADLIKLADAIYKSRLADKLRAQGYALRSTKNGFEIASISDETIENWSPRKAQIDKLLSYKGLSRESATDAQKQWVTLATRDKKEDVPTSEYISLWQKMAEDQKLFAAKSASIPAASPEEIAANSLLHLSERSAIFRQPALWADSLTQACAYYSQAEMELPIAKTTEDHGIILKDKKATTYTHIEQESFVLEASRIMRGQSSPLMVDMVTRRAWLQARESAQGFRFSNDQKTALESLLTSQDRLQLLVGAAGSGKTTTMGAMTLAAQQAGYRVRGLAPSHAAASALRESTGDAATLAFHLQNPPASDAPPTLWIVDEAGMIGTENMGGLLASLGPSDRVLLVGDPLQLSAVSAGIPFAHFLADAPQSPALTEIRRQQDADQRRIAALFAAGRGREAAALLAARAHEVEDSGAMICQAAQAFIEARQRGESTLLLASKNNTIAQLNDAVQKALHGDAAPATTITSAKGVAMTRAERERAASYAPGTTLRRGKTTRKVKAVDGDRVTFEQGNELTIAELAERGWRAVDVEALDLFVGDLLLATDTLSLTDAEGNKVLVRNGAVLSVVKASASVLTVADAVGKQWEVDASQPLPLALGWARTIHRAQGATVDSCIVADDEISGARAGYVSASRQKRDIQIFTLDKDDLAERVKGWAVQQEAIAASPAGDQRLAAARAQGRLTAWQQFGTPKPQHPAPTSVPVPAPLPVGPASAIAAAEAGSRRAREIEAELAAALEAAEQETTQAAPIMRPR